MSRQLVREVESVIAKKVARRRECEIHGDTPEQILRNARAKFDELGYSCDAPSLLTRAIEVVVAVVALILLSPVFLILALLIRRGSPGPVLFKQTRILGGLHPFTFYKFRSFYHDADQRFPDFFRVDHSHEDDGDFQFKVENDPRMTPQGVWLRSTSLDELPNFWNLLKGDIALVGPRPEIPEMLPNYENYMLEKFSVRPGITGMAQVSGRSDLTFREGIECDLDYVEKRSVYLDCKILWLTFIKCLTGEGAR